MLSMSTFGELSFRTDSAPADLSLGGTTAELFAFLALNNDRAHRREKLAEMVWPGKPAHRSRSTLNTTVWRINSRLRKGGLDRMLTLTAVTDTTIRLTVSPDVDIDCITLPCIVGQIEAAVRDGNELSHALRSRMQTALAGYRGPFLEGHDAEWILRERERLHSFYVRGMTLLMHVLAREGRYEEALERGREILGWDDVRETVQREVMWLYVMNGQRCEAIAQYQRFRHRLREEIDVDPMSETESLYRYILRDTQPQPRAEARSSSAADLMEFMARCEHRRSSIFTALARNTPEE